MSLIILFVAPLLFVYWFRYACLLVLHSRLDAIRAADVAATIRLNFASVERSLDSNMKSTSLERLQDMLEDDYRTLTDLLRPLGGAEGLDRRLLMLDYRLMRWWFSVCRTALPGQSRAALREMARILEFLAGDFGQRAAASSNS
ncbi:MAG: hypothetical protein ACKV22_24900 [Bryobacteraceae bacterium]